MKKNTKQHANWDLEPAPYPEDSGDGWYLHRGEAESLFLSTDEVSQEHALLISAAPDLLAALQECLPIVESIILDGEEEYFPIQEFARSAIAKAIGGE